MLPDKDALKLNAESNRTAFASLFPPVLCVEKQVKVENSTKLAIRFWGNENDASTCAPEDRFIAVHGFLDNAGTFDLLAPRMIQGGAVAIACLDLAGHGWSDWRTPYRGMDWVFDIPKVADQLGWDKFSLVSHSLGGTVCLAFAACCPTRVSRLVVIEALGWMSQDGKGAMESVQKAIVEPPKGKNIQTYTSLVAAAERRAAMDLVGNLPVDAAMRLVQRGTKQVDGGFAWSSDPACLATNRESHSEDFIQEMMSHIQCPTLLLVADDGVWKSAGARSLPEPFAGLELNFWELVLPFCGAGAELERGGGLNLVWGTALFGARLFSPRWYATVYSAYARCSSFPTTLDVHLYRESITCAQQ